jgi:membrane protein implicated in regulation of membrane protease activity
LVPKCPLCIVAYLAIGGGLGMSLTTATHLRTALVWLCWSVLGVLAVRLMTRFVDRTRTSRRYERSSEACRGMTSIRASARLI